MSGTLQSYYKLTKPGIIRGNLITALAGFLLASKGSISYVTLVALIIGMALVIASSCVFNNYIDRDIDKKMSRTKHRALVEGTISVRNALIFATVLFILGAITLQAGTNTLTLAMGVLGAFFYVVVYGIGKRKTVHGTLIGTISGALPPVAGYTAASNLLDGGAALIFVILVLWQMPHFFAIATYRRKEYAAAGLPVLPVIKDISAVRLQMLAYITLFALVTPLLSVFGYTGYSYLVIMLLCSLWWLYIGFIKYKSLSVEAWARSMFHVSLLIITVWSLTLSIDHFLP